MIITTTIVATGVDGITMGRSRTRLVVVVVAIVGETDGGNMTARWRRVGWGRYIEIERGDMCGAKNKKKVKEGKMEG